MFRSQNREERDQLFCTDRALPHPLEFLVV